MSYDFVITLHTAERAGQHQDLYLSETEDALNYFAWALPKGFPTTSGVRRLAIRVQDHSRQEATFEGEITSGYGKGVKEIWDEGTYVPHTLIIANGPIQIDFHGGHAQGTHYLKHWEGNHWLIWRT